jgi:hypothetical protein
MSNIFLQSSQIIDYKTDPTSEKGDFPEKVMEVSGD